MSLIRDAFRGALAGAAATWALAPITTVMLSVPAPEVTTTRDRCVAGVTTHRVRTLHPLDASTLDAIPITPRIGIVAKLYDGGVTKLVAGSAFRAPNIFETFQSGCPSNPPIVDSCR